MPRPALLLSIHPRFAEAIFSGKKAVELRTRKPRVRTGDLVFVYVSSPTKALLGAFEVKKVTDRSPAAIWKHWKSRTGLTKKEFDIYFKCRKNAFAIEVGRKWRIKKPVPLAKLRRKKADFRPPQAYHYWPVAELLRLSGNDFRVKNGRRTRIKQEPK